MKPYWKSPLHISIFILMILGHVFFITAFIIDMMMYIKNPEPVDPNAPSRVSTLVVAIALVVDCLIDFVFFFDLFRYIRLKTRLARNKNIKSNVEIYAEGESKEAANKEASKMFKMNEIIADITDAPSTDKPECEFKQESIRFPSVKATLVTTFYVAGIPLLIVFAMFFAFLFSFFFLLDFTHPVQDLINAATFTVLLIVIIVVLYIIIFIIQRIRMKKKIPSEAGLRIYSDYVEQYVIKNTENKIETRFKVGFDVMKRKQTKNFYLIKGRVNNQAAAITIIKNEAPEAAIKLIEEKYLKAREAKKDLKNKK